MKRTIALTIGMVICASMAHGGDIKVTASMASSTYNTESPKLTTTFKTKGAKKGDKLRAVWFADDVGDAAPPHTKVYEQTGALEGDSSGDVSATKPAHGWPPGKYHVDLYANDELAATLKFKVEGLEKAEKRDLAEKAAKGKSAKESAESADDEDGVNDDVHDSAADDDTQYSFKVRNHNEQKIIKLLASEDGKHYKNFDIGEPIEVGETVELNWDESTNNAGCKWYLKAVYADKSEGEPVKFDFCQEDLVIDF